MYILIVCILAPLVQNGLSLNREETDLKSLSNYETSDDINENYDIWGEENEDSDAGNLAFDTISKTQLEGICKDSDSSVYIAEEDITIDCKAFKSDKSIDSKIIKRSVEQSVEGSGDGDDQVVTTQETGSENNKDKVDVQLQSKNEENKKDNTDEDVSKVDVQLRSGGENGSANTESSDQIMTNEAQIVTKIEPVTEKTEESGNEAQITTEPATTIPKEKDEVTGAHVHGNEAEKIPNATKNSEENQNIPTTVASKNNEIENPEETKTAQQNEDTNRTDEKPKETDYKPKSESHDPKTDAEIIQGRTLIDTQKQESKESTKDTANDVKTDESTQDTKKAGTKDTTILVFLFVAVLVVGALAFGYNFIKKRKQRSADLERVERAPSIKRSLQNLTNPENELEKKPLMGDQKEVEMVDMKKENNVHEAEKPSETTVKS